ncbi:MAG TPA: glycosyltransferase [Polyangiaceae bacterium]|nr:glycosyltransferase [Polyangiaceae bacterium]
MSRSLDAVLVVPCYNEARRFDARAFLGLSRSADTALLLVDDGSTDDTSRILSDLAREEPEAISTLRLPKNLGKGEAVRIGLQRALEARASVVGYADADLSTPPEELANLLAVARSGRADAVLGSRISFLGAEIHRARSRHYFGRAFATAASLVLGIPVYDTQCGAKFFRATPSLRASLEEPFHGAWVFDVELLGRLLIGAPGVPAVPLERFVEVPLRRWTDVPGGTLDGLDLVRAAADLVAVGLSLSRRRDAIRRSEQGR